MTTASLPRLSVPAAIRDAVFRWDLTNVKRRMVKLGYKSDRIDELETEYKKFILCNVALNNPCPISPEVDEMWHAHILFTRDYAAFCSAIRPGFFIHHQPTMSAEEVGRLMTAYKEKTLPALEALFGSVNADFWPANLCVCSDGGDFCPGDD